MTLKLKISDGFYFPGWLSSYSTIKGIRENLIYNEQCNIIGRAKGLQVFFDINPRKPIQIFDDIKKIE